MDTRGPEIPDPTGLTDQATDVTVNSRAGLPITPGASRCEQKSLEVLLRHPVPFGQMCWRPGVAGGGSEIAK